MTGKFAYVWEMVKTSFWFIPLLLVTLGVFLAFGLVYLEAMAKGCIVIGTKGQGIDGVIIDKVNGFLCEAKNIDELTEIFKRISSMPKEELKNISKNAIQTARQLTDEKAAKKYLDSVINC